MHTLYVTTRRAINRGLSAVGEDFWVRAQDFVTQFLTRGSMETIVL